MTKLRFLLLLVLFVVGGYLWVKGPEGLNLPEVTKRLSGDATKDETVTATVNVKEGTNGAVQATVKVEGGSSTGGVKVHYFTKEALAACSTETVTREVAPDSKYGHAGAGALVAQTLALTGEDVEKYASALASGTRLLSMKMSTAGVATANYNAQLNEGLNDCNKPQRRAQIERTLKEFAEVKEVVITVQGEKWD